MPRQESSDWHGYDPLKRAGLRYFPKDIVVEPDATGMRSTTFWQGLALCTLCGESCVCEG